MLYLSYGGVKRLLFLVVYVILSERLVKLVIIACIGAALVLAVHKCGLAHVKVSHHAEHQRGARGNGNHRPVAGGHLYSASLQSRPLALPDGRVAYIGSRAVLRAQVRKAYFLFLARLKHGCYAFRFKPFRYRQAFKHFRINVFHSRTASFPLY